MKSDTDCSACGARGRLVCTMDYRALAYFWALTLGIVIPGMTGMVVGRYYWGIAAYVAMFMVLAHFVVPGFLCRHCPFYAEPGIVLRCPAHYGSLKLWKYAPKPLNRLERALVFICFALLFGYYVPFLVASRQWMLLAVLLWNIIIWLSTMRRYVCASCVNFTCPMNGVSPAVIDAYERDCGSGTDAEKE